MLVVVVVVVVQFPLRHLERPQLWTSDVSYKEPDSNAAIDNKSNEQYEGSCVCRDLQLYLNCKL